MNLTTINGRHPSTPDMLQFLRALQFGDSMLPVGAFSFSNGIESAVQQGVVHDLRTLEEFVRTALEQSAGADGLALLAAHRAARENNLSQLLVADRAVFCRKLNEEFRTMSTRMGRKLAEMALHIDTSLPLVGEWLECVRNQTTPGGYPVGQGLIFAGLQLSEQNAFAVHQYGIASLMLGAVLRVMRVSYLDTQTILFTLHQESDATYERIKDLELDDMTSYAPMMDILAGVHVKSKVRMFMN